MSRPSKAVKGRQTPTKLPHVLHHWGVDSDGELLPDAYFAGVHGYFRKDHLDGEDFPNVISGRADRVTAVAWSPDGKQIASASRDKTLQVWKPEKP